MRTHHLPIQGATCQGCANKIRTALGAVPGADEIQVLLAQDPDTFLRLEITDQGNGFDPSDLPADRFGLAGIQERVKALHGRLEIESAVGQGTTIRVTFPAESSPATGR